VAGDNFKERFTMRIDANNSLNAHLLLQRAKHKVDAADTPKAPKVAPQRPAAQPAAIPPPTPADPPAASAPATRLDALLQAWGQESSIYDLNADGSVDGADLGQLLASNSPTLSAAPPAPAETPQAPTTTRVDNLLGAWGQSDSIYDLNADGTVDGADLGQLLASNTPTTSAEPVVPDRAPPTTTNTRVDALLNNWGQSDSAFDLTGDGTVDGADLGALLLGQTSPGAPADPAPAQSQPAGPSISDFAARITRALFAETGAEPQDLRAAHRVIAQGLASSLRENPALNLDALASRLLDSLLAGGGTEKPELALRRTVDQLDLSPRHHQAMLHRLASIYPHGLGVNKLG
jgi:hypothetical protein